MPPRDFAFWAKSLRGQQKKVNGNCLEKCVEGMTNKARKLLQIGKSVCNKEDTLSIARITNLAKVQTYFCIKVKKAL